jgi:hypothetical protein
LRHKGIGRKNIFYVKKVKETRDLIFLPSPSFIIGAGIMKLRRQAGVARWFVFKPKIQIWEGLAKEDVGIFYGLLLHFMDIWYSSW